MALIKTRYEGLYYRLNKYDKKVFVARIYKDGKDTTKTLGKELNITIKIANKLRLDILDDLNRGYTLKYINKNIDELFNEYLEIRKNSVSELYLYNCNKNYIKYLKNVIGNHHPKDVTSSMVQKVVNQMLDSGYAP